VVEAMILAALERSPSEITHDDYLEIITNEGIEPRILYPSGYKRISRFAFVIHPLSQQYFPQRQAAGCSGQLCAEVLHEQR